MKIKIVLLTLMLALANIHANPEAQGEMWIRVSTPGDTLRAGVTITVYDINGQYVDHCITSSITVEQQGNAFIYMVNEPISNPDASYVIGPLSYSTTYFFVIDNKYAIINVGSWTATPDEHLFFRNNTFSLNPSHVVFTLGTQGDWNPKTVTAKNSFSGGKLKIDETEYNNVSSSGIQNNFGTPTFPHIFKAFDNQQVPGDFVKRFDDWTTPNGNQTNIEFSVEDPISGLFTANFRDQYNITFINSVVGLGNVGTLRVNGGSPTNMPASVFYVRKNDPITAEGTAFIINGIKYLIDHWSDGPTSSQRTFYPNGNATYTAYYKGYPQMTTVTINTDETGEPVELRWSTHQNSAVNQYRVYRGAKVDGNFTNLQIIATLGSTATSYTDEQFVIGGSSPNSVAYDVVPYYSTEQNWGIVGSQVVSATKELLQKQAGEQGEILADYNLDNYPNPFNPSTKINFTLPEAGFVKLTIYNALGQKIKELVNMQMNQGNYTSTWYGDNEFGKKVNSGIYFSVLESRNRRIIQKMILSK